MKLLQQLKQYYKNGLLVILLGLFFILGSDGTGVPTITILGNNPAIVEQGVIYKDAGATAEDPEDGEVDVVTTGVALVDTSTVGTYFVTYTATDQDKNKTVVKRTITVKSSSVSGIEGIMQNALLVERVKTKSTVNLQAIVTLKSGAIVDGFATWEEYDNNTQITKRYAINNKGDFYIGAEGDAETLLSVLTEKGISTIATWGYPVAKDDIIHPFIQPNIRSNSLASSLYENFRDFMDTADIVTSSNNLKLVYAKPYGKKYGRAALNFEDLEFGLQNKMGASIKVLTSVLNMRQMDTRWACSGCPFNGKAFKDGASAEIHHVLNKKWNPKVTDETDGSGTRSFDLQVTGKKMFYAAQVDGDNRNSGEISIDNNVVESFSNWDADHHIYTQAGHTPSSVKMELRNNWSVAIASFRLAVLGGDIKFSNMAQTPVTGMSNNPAPLLLSIKTGWNIVKAKSKEASFQFKRTSQKVAYGSDYKQACIDEFGSDWALADWNDLKRYFSSGKDMKTLVSRLGLDVGNDSAWVTKDGDNSHSGSRDYYMSYHNHQKPSHYLAHENIDNYFLSLGSWYSPQHSLCIRNTTNLVYADSVSEFSDKQGQDNWYYGYYLSPFQSSEFKLMADFNGSSWVVGRNYWTGLSSTGGHPNGGSVTSGGRKYLEQWAVRRWKSEVSGEITVSGTLKKSNTNSGDGTVGSIFINGEQVWSHSLNYNDSVGINYEVNAVVTQNSVIDFVITPGNSSNDHADGTYFSAIIKKSK